MSILKGCLPQLLLIHMIQLVVVVASPYLWWSWRLWYIFSFDFLSFFEKEKEEEEEELQLEDVKHNSVLIADQATGDLSALCSLILYGTGIDIVIAQTCNAFSMS